MTTDDFSPRPGERLEPLGVRDFKILQRPDRFCFGIDAVLLSHFATPSVTRKKRVVDLGTGTAIIPLLLCAHANPAHIDAVELQPAMADLAARSVALNRLDNTIRVICADLRTLDYPTSSVDIVTANPPYFPVGANKINPDDSVALARHELACTIEDIAAFAGKCLKDRGRLFLVHRAERVTDVLAALRARHLEPKRLRPVYPTREKPAHLILIEAIKKGRPGVIFEQPLVIYKAPDVYSDEVNAMYGTDGPQKRGD